jgi:DNA topoisomerase IB
LLQAWYRRGKVNASLGNYEDEDAARDLIIAKTFELSSGGRRQIESELQIISDQYKRTEVSMVPHNENNLDILGKIVSIKYPYMSIIPYIINLLL